MGPASLLTSLGWMFLFSDVLMSSDDVLINKINNEVGRVQNGLFLVYTKGMRKMVLLGGHILVHTLGKYWLERFDRNHAMKGTVS